MHWRTVYPLPNVEDLLSTLVGGKLFSKLDLSEAYQQLELDKESEKYINVNTHHGLHTYHYLSYGVSSAPSIFQAVMNQILQRLSHVTCFLNDILVTAESKETHLQILEEVLRRLGKYIVKVKKNKCQFMTDKVQYLGHIWLTPRAYIRRQRKWRPFGTHPAPLTWPSFLHFGGSWITMADF